MAFAVALVASLLFGFTASSFALNHENLLRKSLFARWTPIDPHLRPVAHHNHTLTVSFGLDVRHIIRVDPASNTLVLSGIMRLSWEDANLKWNRSTFGGIENISVPSDTLWRPDVALYTSSTGNKVLEFGPSLASLSFDGTVVWHPQVTMNIYCPMDVRDYPFDSHSCLVKWGSWVHDGQHIHLALDAHAKSEGAVTESLINRYHAWHLDVSPGKVSVTYYPCCQEPYVSVDHVITVERRPAFYAYTLVLPLLCAFVVCLAAYCLPPGSGEKLVLTTFSLLVLAVLLVHLSWSVPRNSNGTPTIVSVCGSSFFFVSLSIFVSIITIGLSSRNAPVPGILQTVLQSSAVNKVLLLQDPYSPQDGEQQGDEQQSEQQQQQSVVQWQSFARLVDRVCFVLFAVVFLVLFVFVFA